MWSRLKTIPVRHPLAFGAGFTCLKTTGADLFVQTQLEGREFSAVDWRRTAVYSAFGFCYMGKLLSIPSTISSLV